MNFNLFYNKNSSKKRLFQVDEIYNNYLVSLLITRILKSGNKNIAKKIVYNSFKIIKKKTAKNPLQIFEKAVQNASPLITIKPERIRGTIYQVPLILDTIKATDLALRWIIYYSKQRSGLNMTINLANEIIDTSNHTGKTIKKKNETHRIAKSNKVFLRLSS